MAALSSLSECLVETVEQSAKSLRTAAEITGVEITDGQYAPLDRPAVIPQSLRTADFVLMLVVQAEREAQLVAVVEALALKVNELESKGGRKSK
jgi:hypothetical protein